MKMTEDPSVLGATQATVFVGALIETNGRYQLVQEAKAGCRGSWNIPGGHLQATEGIPKGATREVYEETGHQICLTGLCPIVNCVTDHGTLILFPYTAKIIVFNASRPNPTEILQTGWFTRAEIEAMQDDLRYPELIMDLLDHYEQGHIYPLDVIQVYKV